jgi:hypothetical protein
MYLWDKTIPQGELTLNLLRGSRINPKLSAWEQIHGRYDFNAHPIAPPGIKVLAHAKPAQRKTWEAHAFEAWYGGPALDHYRCHTVWAKETRQVRIVNQLQWFPQRPFPRINSLDLLRATAKDLITLLIIKEPPTETFLGTLEDTMRGDLIQLSEVLYQHATTLTEKGTNKALAPSLGVAPEEGPRKSTRLKEPPDRYSPHFNGTAINPDTGAHAEYRELSRSSDGPRWIIAMCKEIGRLFQGYTCKLQPEHTVQGTSTCQFIRKKDMPAGKTPTYVRTVADYREHKADPYRVRSTVGGNLMDFPRDKSTKVAELVTCKALINNVISTPGARAACAELKDFYLGNQLPNAEYIRFKAELIPPEIWAQYNLDEYLEPDGYIYARVDKGMYGLPQAGKVASDYLIPRLQTTGYEETG